MTAAADGFRRVVRVTRRLVELGHPGDVLGALQELQELRDLVGKLTPRQRAWLEAKGDPRG